MLFNELIILFNFFNLFNIFINFIFYFLFGVIEYGRGAADSFNLE